VIGGGGIDSAPVMRPRGGAFRKIACIVLVPLLLGLAACDGREERTEGEEGEYVHAGEAVYQVQLTRLLNPRQRPDETLVRGQAALPSDEQFLAVFLRIQNEGNEPYSPPRDMKVVDSEGNEYLPLDATQSGFGLDFGEEIAPDDQVPLPNSPAAEGPNGAAMVLFRVKIESATDNLPLELEVPTGGEEGSRIVLDV
jgi:hypothetical protein